MVHATRLAMRHEPIYLTTSRFFITGDAATPHSEARFLQQFTRLGSRSSPRQSWRPERYRVVPENPMEGHYSHRAHGRSNVSVQLDTLIKAARARQRDRDR